MSAPGPHVAELESRGIAHVAVPAFTRSTNPILDVRALGQLVGILRRLRPDILHTHNPKPGVLGRIAGRVARVPLVVNTQHGLYAQPDDGRARRVAVYAAERVAAAFGDVELVQNVEDVRTLTELLRVPQRKVRLLGNGIDLRRFDPASVPAGSRRRLRAEWGVDERQVVVGVVGRLVTEKGIAELLEAAHTLHRDGLGVRLVVVGPSDPSKADAVPQELLERARADGVVLAGGRTDMPECYAAFDLFATASWREGFPRSVMEAAAMGLATVATDVRGNRQAVHDGVTGVLVPVRRPPALAAAIRRLATAPAERAAMAAAARELARREFDQERVVERTLDAYASPAR
jgi:glycosyltransferase involved in cell wall biosynthesis